VTLHSRHPTEAGTAPLLDWGSPWANVTMASGKGAAPGRAGQHRHLAGFSQGDQQALGSATWCLAGLLCKW